jgi:uncharacterized membrane protein YfcA
MAPVTGSSGWRPIQKPNRGGSTGSTGLAPGPFTRLARSHALGAAADGLVTVALAGSIFFSIEPGAARWRVALYLVLTIAPFAVVTPLIGPIIDRARGGRRTMILGASFARAVVAFLMAGRIHSILLFPLAFAVLVLQKAYAVAKSAVVPKLVDSEHQLVEANSKLALLSAIGTMTGAAFGALLSLVGGAAWPMSLAVIVYIAAGLAGLQIPRTTIAENSTPAIERAELRGAGIVLAGSAMGFLRGIVGFLTFLLAFELRGGKDGVDIKPLGAAAGASTAIARKINIVGDPGAPAWHFGVVVAAAGIGALVGAQIAPRLRRSVPEERILLGVLGLVAMVGIFATWNAALFGGMLLALAVSLAAGAGKLAFDSLVQRDAPDANYGRSFARFEARFQLTWVVGAFIPVVLPFPMRAGYAVVAVVAGFATISYFFGARAAAHEPADHLVADDGTWVIDTAARPAASNGTPREPAADITAVLRSTDDTEVFPPIPPPPPPPPVPSPAEAVPPPAPPPQTMPPTRWGEEPVGPFVTSVEGVEVDPDIGRPTRSAPPRAN